MDDVQALLKQAETAVQNQAFAEALDLFERVLHLTEEATAVAEIRAQAFTQKGELLRHLGDQTAALQTFQTYYDTTQSVEALIELARQYNVMGQMNEALSHYRKALQTAQKNKAPKLEAKALYGMGTAFRNLGQTEEAFTQLRQALALFQRTADIYQQHLVWNAIALVHHDLGEIDKAIAGYNEALLLARKLMNQSRMSIVLGNLGECYQDLFDMEQARQYHQEALDLVLHENVPSQHVADLRRNLGVDLCGLGQFEEGLKELYTALAMSQDADHLDNTMQVLCSLTLAEMDYGNLDQAWEHIDQLQKLAESNQLKAYLGRAYHARGLYAFHRGKINQAEQYWQQALFMAHETGQRMLLWRIHGVLATLAPNPALKAVHKRIAAEVIEQIAHPIKDHTLREKFLKAKAVRAVLD